MKTLKHHILTLLLCSFALAASAQVNYDIHSTTVSESFDSKDKLTSRRIWASGVRNNEVLNLEMVVDGQNKVTELTINENLVKSPAVKEYKPLTDFVLDYVSKDVKEVTGEVTVGKAVATRFRTDDEPLSESDRMTEAEDKKMVMQLIKSELIKDALIDNPEVFDFMLTFDSLYINAKKQDDAIFKKYSELYRNNTAVPITNGTYFQITQSL
jgi:hypothetical protein